MRKNRLFTTICLMAAILLAACSQDELAEQGNTLPEGEYPLQIGSVSITAEGSEEPWTRVAENETDGMGSHWTGDEEFYVKFEGSDEVGIYKITDAATGAVKPVKSIYWKSTQPANIIAWYAKPQPDDTNNGRIFLNNQEDDGLVYVLRAEQTATYGETPVTLKFKHQLAKVRVVLSGTQASLAQSVEVYGYTTCTNNEGAPVTDGSTQGWLKMKNITYADGTECWEANVVPGTIDLANFIRLNGHAVVEKDNLTDVPEVLDAANMYTINLTVGEKITDINEDNTTINDDGHYRLSGGFGNTITVTGGNPTIYLENANISVGGGMPLT